MHPAYCDLYLRLTIGAWNTQTGLCWPVTCCSSIKLPCHYDQCQKLPTFAQWAAFSVKVSAGCAGTFALTCSSSSSSSSSSRPTCIASSHSTQYPLPLSLYFHICHGWIKEVLVLFLGNVCPVSFILGQHLVSYFWYLQSMT